MKLKKNLLKLTVPIVLIFSFFYILNFVTDKKDALANINNKQIVEVLKLLRVDVVTVMFYF